MTLKVGESGETKIIRVAGGFDMSSNTELTLIFTLPDNTTVTKTKTGGEVTLGTSNITDKDLGALLANEYVEYKVEPGFLTQKSIWKVILNYTNTASTPDDEFIGGCAEFTVYAGSC